MRPGHYDRFVLIGLCWLYGRSEFPPPPPPYVEIWLMMVIISSNSRAGLSVIDCTPAIELEYVQACIANMLIK